MRILTLDPKRTHQNNPDCPSRLVPTPNGLNWQCIDCGCYILMTSVPLQELQRDEVVEPPKPGDLVE